MDRASAIIMGFLGVVLLSIAALFWVLTSGDGTTNEAAPLLRTGTSSAVGGVGSTTRSTAADTVRTTPTSTATPTSTTAGEGSTRSSVTVTTVPSISTVLPTVLPTVPSVSTSRPPANVGAASPQLVTLLGRVDAGGIRFGYRSDDLNASAMSLLDELAQRLQEESALRLSVAGHTDADGTPADNAALSARRANAVVDHLVSRGVAADRLEIRAAGHLEPIADNSSDTGRSANRRVEIELLGAGR
ncbi:MAG: OmpA family protein [Acidimicrobiales bacterium]